MISFVIPGNHESKTGNPIPYVRMTQRSKFKNRQAKRYRLWKSYVVGCLIDCRLAGSTPLKRMARGMKPLMAHRKVRVNTKIYFTDSKVRADPDNVHKGILDALFDDDRNVVGVYDFFVDPENPRVEVTIDLGVS